MSLRLSDLFALLGIGAGMVVSHLIGQSGIVTAFFALSAVVACGYVGGKRLMPDASNLSAVFWGSVASLALLMVFRGGWFYAGGHLGGWGDVWTTLMMIATVIIGALLLSFQRTAPAAQRAMIDRRSVWDIILEGCSLGVSIAGVILIGYVAWKLGTTEAIRTPWPLLPSWVLPMVGLLWALVLVTAWRQGRGWIVGVQAACAIGATVVIAPLLYKIGFGFDGFLHVAGESVLAKTGTLSPAPPYYMGQYVFVTWIAPLFNLPIALVDRWLVAATAMVLIPAAALFGRRTPTMLAALVLVPVAPLVATTPHGFAITLAIAALLSYPQGDDAPLPGTLIALLLAAWAALTHPLVGLPVFGAIMAATLWGIRYWVRYPLSFFAAIGAGISVPVVFSLAASLGSSAGVAFNVAAVTNVDAWGAALAALVPWTANRYALWAQASVWIEQVVPWMMVALAATAIGRRVAEAFQEGMLAKEPSTPHRNGDLLFILAASVTFIAALVMQRAGDFHFLIDYERGNYTERLFDVALLLLLPVVVPTFAWLLARAKHAAVPSVAGITLAVALLGAGATYAALPRHDAVTPSRGWSVSASDVNAVRLIDRDAAGEPYTVLANQSVSAAAVREFGFARYHNDIFFYPIPTGGALYDLFLRASYEDPSRATMADAARLGGSHLVYLVINDYWWKANEISERAEAEADRAFVVDDGAIKIFKYTLSDLK
ncbi:MAG: hypothetical protein RL141_360 [Candidatus Parcubacteria bacterium]|jgi:hypothetical protein